jgi:hypothetical protein
MVIGREGYPIVAFRDQEKNAVVLIACGDVACSPDTRTTTVLDTGGEKADKVGFNLVMVKDGESRPLVLYRNDTTGALNLMQCGDSACTGPKRTHRIVDGHAAGSKVGFETSAVVSGNVLYAVYRDENAKSLKLARVRLTSRGRYRPGF